MIKILMKVSGMRLTAENLSARRGEDLIFTDISFTLGAGESLVLTGRNGSGKSTLLRVVAGLLRPEAGRVTWISDKAESGMRAAEACHYLGHRNAMKAELTVFENLSFWKDFLGDAEDGKGVSRARPRRPWVSGDHPSALRLSLRRPAAPHGVCQAARRL